MEAELQKIVRVYLKSSKGKEYLGKKDFQNLVSSQLSNILTEADSKDAVDNMSKGLDSDQDGVGFDDYMKLVGYLACSLSQQRTLETETSANSTASAQEPQSPAGNEGEKAEAKAEAKVEAKTEQKAEATAEAKVNAEPKVDVKVEVKAEGEAKLEAKVEAAAAATTATKVEEKKAEETAKVEPAAEEKPASAEKDVEKKTGEAAAS
ncbi:uncharacterized protein LOC101154789 [Oryzias latipes]|uniref:S100 calcium binding protein U n=1 Tax=Oryzias latipes TaxID=8090 RepID=A0A3B3HWI0_ORYLA|nr:uncharacterized protein LOC101154789 [Oryzias latipes]XP_020562579.1 uncharacterized protein LOC101154789 [Oryzias latipes]